MYWLSWPSMQLQDGLWDLPGFSEARDYLDRKGLSSTWVDEVVDPSGRLACFEKNGKPHYRSECPAYEGYWLDGSTGSVQCRNVPFLQPGLQWDNTCSKNPEQCPFLLKKDDWNMKRALRRSYLSKRRALPFIPKITALGFLQWKSSCPVAHFWVPS